MAAATGPVEKSAIQQTLDWPAKVSGYFNELRAEMRRVTWPTQKQVQSTTLVVIVTVFAFAAYFKVVDEVLARGINSIQHTFTKK